VDPPQTTLSNVSPAKIILNFHFSILPKFLSILYQMFAIVGLV